MFAALAAFLADAVYTLALLAGVVIFLVALFLKPILLVTGAGLGASPLIQPVRAVGKTAGVLLALWGGGSLYLQRHDAALVAQWSAKAEEAVAVAREQDAAASNRAVAADAQGQITREAQAAVVRSEIAHAPPSNACAASPAIRALLVRMRTGAGAGGDPPQAPAGVAGVPAGTAAPAPRH